MSKAPEKAEGAEAAPKSGKKQQLIIIIAVVVALLLGGVGALVFLKKSAPAEDEEGAPAKPKSSHAKKDKSHPATPPAMFKLEPFVVKLQPDENKPEQYMQTVLELEVIDSHTVDQVKPMTAKIRSKVLLKLMSKTAAELSTPKGVETLTNELRNEINTILLGGERTPGEDPSKVGPDDLVQGVYMTQFIIQ